MIIDIVLIGASGRGGLEEVISLVSNELNKKGHRVRVVQVFEPKFKEWKRSIREFYTLISEEFSRKLNVEDMINMYTDFIIKEGRPDAILATHVPASSYLWAEALKAINERDNIPVISWVHGPLPAYGENYNELLSFADAHLAISGEIENQLLSLSAKTSVYLVFNPVCIEIDNIKRSSNGILKLLYVGRLEKEKKVDFLIEVLSHVSAKWELNIIGDGEEKENLERIIQENYLTDKVSFKGWCQNPWKEIKEADLLVLLSQQEGFGLVMLEALLRGIPVLSTRTEGAEDIIEDEINGWLVDIDDKSQVEEILYGIANSEIDLPKKEVCMNSVSRFYNTNVIEKIERAIKIEVGKKKRLRQGKVIDIFVKYLSGKGGTESVLKEVINYLSNKGYRIRLIQMFKCKDDSWMQECNVEVYTLCTESERDIRSDLLYVERYEDLINRFGKADIMLATGIPQMSYLCSLIRGKMEEEILIISWIHNPLKRFEDYEKIKCADLHIAISKEIYDEIKDVDAEKEVGLLYNPVKVNNKIVPRCKEKIKIIYAGRIENKQKNIYMLLNSLGEIKGDWNLNIYGKGEDFRWLKGVCEILEIDKKVIWNEWVENIWSNITEASVLVLTSRFEGFGLVVVEALSRGIPVISTNCGIANEIIINGYNGWIVKSEEALKKLLDDIIKRKIELPAEENCIKSCEKFSAEKVLGDIEKFIKRKL